MKKDQPRMVRIFTRETNKELKAKVQLSANQFYDLCLKKGIVLIFSEQSADFIRQFRRTVWGPDYPFQIAYSRPVPSEKIGEWVSVWRARLYTGQSISSSSVKTAKNKIPVSSILNDSEGLYRTTVCRCLVRRSHYSARLMRFQPSREKPWGRGWCV